ncbi:MAG: hypothetical protein K6F94_07165 [Bacteroidaceae bacterium]|nr:hypothetical protein [Bacteroidaceae bacterium]
MKSEESLGWRRVINENDNENENWAAHQLGRCAQNYSKINLENYSAGLLDGSMFARGG